MDFYQAHYYDSDFYETHRTKMQGLSDNHFIPFIRWLESAIFKRHFDNLILVLKLEHFRRSVDTRVW